MVVYMKNCYFDMEIGIISIWEYNYTCLEMYNVIRLDAYIYLFYERNLYNRILLSQSSWYMLYLYNILIFHIC
jgi:hypothetical protein